MPSHYEVGLCGCWEPTCAAGEWAELRWGVRSTLVRNSSLKPWKDCVFARESVIAMRRFGKQRFVTSFPCLSQEYPVPKRVHGQELQDFENFTRGEDDITGVLTYKLGACPGTGPSSSPGCRNEWQRSLKEAPKGSPCFGERGSLPQEQCPEL